MQIETNMKRKYFHINMLNPYTAHKRNTEILDFHNLSNKQNGAMTKEHYIISLTGIYDNKNDIATTQFEMEIKQI